MPAASGNLAILSLTVIAAATVTGNCFVTRAGTLPAAGGNALGVSRYDGVAGDQLVLDILGTTIVKCGAAVAADAPLMVDATGAVVTLAGSAKQSVGRALEAGAAAGSLIEMLLIPSTGLVTA